MLQSTLGQLRLNNIATLDALATHFTRLIDLTSADETYISALATTLAPCILRPRTENSLTLEERHAYRLIRDLFDHKEAIFGELKRQSSVLSGSNSVSTRQRAVSQTDESSRRANMEARARAITERQREKSPAPTNRHRRDKSTDGNLGRFPVVASPHSRSVSGVGLSPATKRSSLDVPGSAESSPIQTRNLTAVERNSATRIDPSSHSITNGQNQNSPDALTMPGTFSGGGPGPHIPPPLDDDSQESDSPVPPAKDHEPSSRSESLKKTAATGERKPVGVGRVTSASLRNRLASGSGGIEERSSAPTSQGVQLTDKAMDDFS